MVNANQVAPENAPAAERLDDCSFVTKEALGTPDNRCTQSDERYEHAPALCSFNRIKLTL